MCSHTWKLSSFIEPYQCQLMQILKVLVFCLLKTKYFIATKNEICLFRSKNVLNNFKIGTYKHLRCIKLISVENIYWSLKSSGNPETQQIEKILKNTTPPKCIEMWPGSLFIN